MKLKSLVAGGLLLLMSFAANSTPITITGYDIDSTHVSGTGGWKHTYSGTITPLSGSLADYSGGGSGTLNDGIIGASHHETQLFNYPTESSAIITLFLDDYYSLDSILIHGGNFGNNTIPGTLTGLDVTINSATESFATTAQGMAVYSGLADDLVDVGSSSLGGLVTNQITLSGFVSTWNFLNSNVFSIAEISLDGNLAAVPEPSNLVLFLLGLAGLGFSRRRSASK